MDLKKRDLESHPFDAIEYLSATFETVDPSWIRNALATLARPHGMSATAETRTWPGVLPGASGWGSAACIKPAMPLSASASPRYVDMASF